MENENNSNFIGIINSEKWKQLKGYFNHYSISYENFDFSKPENEIIEYIRILYSNIDEQLNNALVYLQTNAIDKMEKNKILVYCKELNKLKFDCLDKLNSLNSKPLDYELILFDYMDLMEKPKQIVSKYFYEIENEFNEFIKIEVSKNKENTINPFPDIFKGTDNKTFTLFKNFSEKHIIDWYQDYSFLFQKMKKDDYLHNVKHLDFMQWLKSNKYISEKTLDAFIRLETFSKKYNSAQRINNYNNIVKDLFQ